MKKRPEERDSKIKDLDELAAIIEQARGQGKTVAQASGCFILTHIGHVKYLKYAKSLASILVVSTNTDRSLIGVRREKNRFYVRANERAEMLAALGCVDYVTFFDGIDASEVIEKIRPHFFVKGSDYVSKENVRETGLVESHGGQVIIAPTPKIGSSTHFIQVLRTDRQVFDRP